MTGAGLTALLSHWRRNPWQLLTLVTGLALATALWSGVQAINAEARASYAAASDTLGAGDLSRLTRRDGQALTVAEYVSLRRNGWLVSPVMEGELRTPGGVVLLTGIDPLTFPTPAGAGPSATGPMQNLLLDDGPVLFAHPDDVPLLTGFDTDVRPDDRRPRGQAMADIALADRLLQGDGQLRYLVVAPAQPPQTVPLPDVYTISEPLAQTDVSRLTRSFHVNLTAFGMLSFAVGIFIVYGAVGLAFEQRRPVFRTLRALGLPLTRLMALLAVELTFFALVAGALGVTLGYLIAAALLPDVAATLRGLYGAEVTGQLQLRPVWWLSGLGMAFGGTAIAAGSALIKLARMPLLSFNHPRAMSLHAGNAGRWMLLLALVLFGTGALISQVGEGLFAGFGLLACLLTGAALCLPWVLAVCLSLAGRISRGPVSEWFWADSRQQLPGLSMALMALLLAMAANIGVSTMVSSFRLTFTGYLDQRLSSELYLRVSSAEQAAEIEQFLVAWSVAVLPIVSVDLREGGLPAELFGLRDHATYRDNWPLLSAVDGVWDRLAAGQGALINEQLARRQNLSPGDTLGTGDVVLGVYSDYGNPAGQIIISEQQFGARYPGLSPRQFGLRTETPDELARTLRNTFELPADALINQRDLKDFSLSVFERTFSVTAALNLLTLSVAGLAILISLLTLATMRLPQLAPVWALGLTRRRLARLELLRAVCLAALTGLLAVPLGLGLAWVLLAVVNVEAFGWRLPMFLFPWDMLQLGVLTMLAAFLAALWPAIRLARTPPQMLLKVFSNER
ncbi:FtsX-like permease family protein [uncultured Roseobacter sp.]|uniref:FtsX-like permease family protein n=1 Tax=uncultured Roseobacter sp. TaxID=114847 RepID=UPI0026336A9B|nr:FtsX-like permease family protein [uncultured Roseobacter sp.]